MQAERNLSKPPREPDFMTNGGSSYFWFAEKIYLNPLGQYLAIVIDQEEGLIRLGEPFSVCRKCIRCHAERICARMFFSADVQAAYRYWDTGEFETILGLNSE